MIATIETATRIIKVRIEKVVRVELASDYAVNFQKNVTSNLCHAIIGFEGGEIIRVELANVPDEIREEFDFWYGTDKENWNFDKFKG